MALNNRFSELYQDAKTFVGDLRSTNDPTLGEELRTPGSASIVGARKNVTYTGVDIKAVVHVPLNFKGGNTVAERNFAVMSDKLTKQRDQGIITEDAFKRQFEELGRLADEAASGKGPRTTTLVLADLQTISWSIHREKYPVRALNHVYPKNFTRGTRTLAGSMIFTVFNEHTLAELINIPPNDFAYQDLSAIMIDQLPPFDVTLVFANEYGHLSQMAILGIELVNEGMTFSIQDLMTENAISYMARELVTLKSVGFAQTKGDDVTKAQKASSPDATSISNFIIESSKNVELINALNLDPAIIRKSRNPFK